ncbi:MAG: molybdenum cofactor biosynthesis protein MoaE [Gammaproteobacteria bacterium]
MQVKISEKPFEPWGEVRAYQEAASRMTRKFGATNIFIGTMRDFNEGDDIVGMTLEHYPGMTEKEIEKIVRDAANRWPLLDALVVHRVGEIQPGDPIVLVAVWTSHRGDAFDASRYIMEALKSRAPFWKKEVLGAQRARWVAQNSDGYQKG